MKTNRGKYSVNNRYLIKLNKFKRLPSATVLPNKTMNEYIRAHRANPECEYWMQKPGASLSDEKTPRVSPASLSGLFHPPAASLAAFSLNLPYSRFARWTLRMFFLSSLLLAGLDLTLRTSVSYASTTLTSISEGEEERESETQNTRSTSPTFGAFLPMDQHTTSDVYSYIPDLSVLDCHTMELDEIFSSIIHHGYHFEDYTALEIQNCVLENSELNSIVEIFPNLTSLTLQSSVLLNPNQLQNLRELTQLRTLYLFSTFLPNNPEGLDLEVLHNFNLTHLSLDGTRILSESLAALVNIHELTELDLSGTGITDESLLVIPKQLALLNLDLSNNPGISNLGLYQITHFSSLQHLDISFTHISGHGIPLITLLPSLEELYVVGLKTEEKHFMLLRQKPNLSIFTIYQENL